MTYKWQRSTSGSLRLYTLMTSSVATSNAQRNSSESTRLFEDGKNYVRFQRSQREAKFTVPIGGRAAASARQKRFESDSSWSAKEEAAFRKAFGKPSEPVKEQQPVATGGSSPQQRGMYSNRYTHRGGLIDPRIV